MLQLQFCWGRLMAVAASPLGGLGAVPLSQLFSFLRASFIRRSQFPFYNVRTAVPLFRCSLARRPARCCLPVRSIVTVLSSLTACPSARPPVRLPSIRWADGHVQQARARVHCAASHHRVKGSIFPPSILDVMGRKADGAGDSRTGGQGMHVCIGDECRAEREGWRAGGRPTFGGRYTCI